MKKCAEKLSNADANDSVIAEGEVELENRKNLVYQLQERIKCRRAHQTIFFSVSRRDEMRGELKIFHHYLPREIIYAFKVVVCHRHIAIVSG